jgi:hypothetical protein
MANIKNLGTIIVAVTALTALGRPALADGDFKDRIVLELATEGWVETQTAEVIVAVNATISQEQAAGVRADILKTLQTLAPKADWRITTFNRNADRSGLDSWYVQAQARIADTQLDGMRQAAEKTSKPGMQISINAINFTPTLAEVEATRASLRGDLYKSAQAELEQVNQAFPGSPYHIGVINFTSQPIGPMIQQDSVAYARAPMAMEKAQSNIQVQDRIQLQATVVLVTDDDKAQ